MDFIGYPLLIGAGSIFMANRYLYRKYFNPVVRKNPFQVALQRSSDYNSKPWYVSTSRFLRDKTFHI